MSAEPDFADMSRRLHQKIKAVLCNEDLEKVAEFLRCVYREGQNTVESVNPYQIRDVSSDNGRSWITGK